MLSDFTALENIYLPKLLLTNDKKNSIELAKKMTENSSQVSVAMTRHMLWSYSSEIDPEEAHIMESKLIDSRGVSDDAKEGVMSFLEKRKPKFSNKVSEDLPNFFPWRESKFKDN